MMVLQRVFLFWSGLTQKLPKSLIYRTAKTPRTPRIRRACVSPIGERLEAILSIQNLKQIGI
ncbi:hypothetical protein GXM_04443 [Nostoc sphaeroides CCNUC1]|uniref:Uncharacterized protein n=1 Tax=Nostoc sphaeroides CCNUC1 TaxID=2653204 RepID=A0A5P8W2S8_9NOSO|nr:hypothetical protein GXM_04443 [Nostoc sphaeroides CCNUC1]